MKRKWLNIKETKRKRSIGKELVKSENVKLAVILVVIKAQVLCKRKIKFKKTVNLQTI